MLPRELLASVRKLEIRTRRTVDDLTAGAYHSVFKGRGIEFEEARPYTPGDDVRDIDWNVTARFNHPFIKVFEEERELTVMLLIDVSGSNNFGTNKQLKQELITEIAAVLSFSAIQNNDKVGVIFFSDIIEKFIPPKKGSSHILRIIRELIDFKAKNTGTNISEALRYLTNVIKKKSTAFLISDFMDNNLEKALQIANYKHDLIAVRVTDDRETEIPNVGMVRMRDAETGALQWVDTSNAKTRNALQRYSREKTAAIDVALARAGVDMVRVYTGRDYVKPLMNLFKKRESRK